AVGEPLGTLERAADRRVRLEPLKFLERREIRVLVVEVNHEADGDLVVLQMVEERAAARAAAQRPAERVLHETGTMVLRRDLPQLLQADAELLRLAPLAQRIFRDELLGER